MKTNSLISALVLSLVGSGAAQDLTKARAFLPDQHRMVVRVDVARLVESGVLDTVARTPAAFFAGQFRRMFGFRIDAIERVEYVQLVREEEGDHGLSTHTQMMILEGKDSVNLKNVDWKRVGHGFESGDMSGFEVHGNAYETYVCTRPGLVVSGSTGFLDSILAKTVRGGVPHMDLVRLTAGAKPLLDIAALAPRDRDPLDMRPVPRDWLSADDPVVAMRVRLDETAAEHVVFEARMRFKTGDKGPALIVERAKAFVAEKIKDRQMIAYKRLFEDLKIAVVDQDAVLTLDLGVEAREMLRYANVMALVLALYTALEPVQAAQVVMLPVQVEEVVEEEEVVETEEVKPVKKKAAVKPKKKN